MVQHGNNWRSLRAPFSQFPHFWCVWSESETLAAKESVAAQEWTITPYHSTDSYLSALSNDRSLRKYSSKKWRKGRGRGMWRFVDQLGGYVRHWIFTMRWVVSNEEWWATSSRNQEQSHVTNMTSTWWMSSWTNQLSRQSEGQLLTPTLRFRCVLSNLAIRWQIWTSSIKPW